jgi:hypothetical protein
MYVIAELRPCCILSIQPSILTCRRVSGSGFVSGVEVGVEVGVKAGIHVDVLMVESVVEGVGPGLTYM